MKQLLLWMLCTAGVVIPARVNGQEFQLPGKESRYFEDIVLYTDRDIYIAGEKIWFKIPCFDQEGRTETVLSKIVLVELYDQQFNTIAKGKFRITHGMATGFLNIPTSINSGNYYIRAYTQFLRNYPAYLYPSSLLSIVNPDKPLPEAENIPADEIKVVPEGGKLIAGVASKVAIRISPAFSTRISSMAIVDDKDSVLTQTLPLPNGLAMFELIPDSAIRYALKITQHDGRVIQKLLPSVSGQGMALTSNYSGNRLKIALLSGHATDGEMQTPYTIQIKSDTYEDLITRSMYPNDTIEIPGNQINTGIVYLVLKNENNTILDIRAAYIPGSQVKEVSIKPSKETFSPRESVNVHVEMPENKRNRNSSLLSVAVAGTLNHSRNLLPAQIAYNPALLTNYLKSSAIHDDSLKKQIDLVLILYSAIYNTPAFTEELKRELVMGWLPEIRDASISGQVIDRKTNKPLPNVMVYAAVIGDNSQIHIYRTQTDGRFYFVLNHLADTQHVYLCPRPLDSLDMELRINTDFSDTYAQPAGLIPFSLDSSQREKLDRLYLNTQVSKAFLIYTEKHHENITYYPLSATVMEHTILLKDFIEMPVMLEVFTEITPFVSVRKRDDHYNLNVYDNKTFTTFTDPLVLLDGIPVFDLDQIMKISPEFIEKVDVTNKISYLGEYTLEGLISIHSIARDFAGITFPETAKFIEYLAVTNESYPVFPEHNTPAETDRNPDFRNLLYWNPLILPVNNSSGLRFYSSDHCGPYEIVFRSYDGSTCYFGKAIIEVTNTVPK